MAGSECYYLGGGLWFGTKGLEREKMITVKINTTIFSRKHLDKHDLLI